MEYNIAPQFPVFVATVYDNTVVAGKIPVTLEKFDDFDDAPLESKYYVYIVTPPGSSLKPPKAGERGIVMFDEFNVTHNSNGFWMGAIYDRHDENQRSKEVNKDKDSNIVSSTNEKAASIVSNASAGVAYGTNQIITSEEETKIQHGRNTLKINDGSITANLFDPSGAGISSFGITNSIEMVAKTNLMFRGQGEVSFRSTGATFSVTGATVESATETTDNKYSSIAAFFVKTKKAFINSGNGPLEFTGGNMVIKLAGGLVGGGGGAPGLGPINTFDLGAATGNVNIFSGTGMVTIAAKNQIGTGVLNLMCGNLLMPAVNTQITLSSAGYNMTSLTPAGAATVSFLAGNGIITTSLNLALNSLMGNIALNAVQSVAISALAAASITTSALTLTAPSIISLTTGALDLTKCATILAGPKMATPGPVGPFCAIPICPMTGAPHLGMMCAG